MQGEVGKDGCVEGQWRVGMGARGILLEVALGCVGSLCELLGDGDHGLGRGMAGCRIAGIVVEGGLSGGGELAEGQGVADEGSEMGGERCPVGVVVRDALGIAFDPAVELAGCGQELRLRLCPGGEGGG